ncbi:MAG: hypothetical protein IJ794_00965 [Lachnospiraceae bacterium]|nr:hypothetical protein [Lachnospiraceae bacterium]
MQNENVKGITDVNLIRKYLDKLMDTEVIDFYRTEENGGKRRFTDSVMKVYLKQDVALSFVEDFFAGHCTYGEMLSAVMGAGKAAKSERHYNCFQLPNEDQEVVSYECTLLECYYWAIGLIASALLQYADCNMVGQMCCEINMEALGKYAGGVKCAKIKDIDKERLTLTVQREWNFLQEDFFCFAKLEEDLGQNVRDQTVGYVLRQLLQQVGSSWKCGVESLLTYRDRVSNAQESLEKILFTPLTALYPERFQMLSLKKKYAVRQEVEKEQGEIQKMGMG